MTIDLRQDISKSQENSTLNHNYLFFMANEKFCCKFNPDKMTFIRKKTNDFKGLKENLWKPAFF